MTTRIVSTVKSLLWSSLAIFSSVFWVEDRIVIWSIKTFGLKGSWKWAKKQMMNGKVVRCKHWTGSLRLKIDDPENTLLLCSFISNPGVDQIHYEVWAESNHFLSYEEFTDYTVV